MTINPAEKLVLFPDFRLRKVAEWVKPDEDITQLVIDMFLVLKTIKSSGLSAPQIGVNKAISICKLSDGDLVLINPTYTPVITGDSKNFIEDYEGCLSLPGVYIKVKRWTKIGLLYRGIEDLQPEDPLKEKNLIEHDARIVQHELDHLAGKLILDYISSLKRDIITRKMRKLQKEIAKQERTIPSAKARTINNIHRMGPR